MVFGSTLLEVAIGMMFVYLLLSLLCSAFSELLESFLRFRASDLKKGIGKLLDDPKLADDFFKHPLVKPLGETPSYIPARTFSLALWNLATKGANVAAGVTQDITVIKKAIADLPDDRYKNLKTSLLTLIDEAGTDIDKARANIEDWYNDAMDRVSGWYKRRTHWILIVMGLLAAALLNVDTINVARALWYNDTLRTSIVAAVDTYIKPPPPAQGESTAPKQDDSAEAQAKAAFDKVKTIRNEINTLNLPIGWGGSQPAPKDAYDWLLKILGILFTALAVSQGAPFWFDLLNKFMVIRSTIKPHEKSQEQPSKDKPAPETIKQQPPDDHPEEDDDKQ